MYSLRELDFDSLHTLVTGGGLASAHVRTLWRGLHRETDVPLLENPDFLPPLRRWLVAGLGSSFHADLPRVSQIISSEDARTEKLLLELADGNRVETVVMGYDGRQTACLSTQAGCAMGCVFCATGQGGFTRHLMVSEIVDQVLLAKQRLAQVGGGMLRNLVLMGMGEPLHNYEAVMAALKIITDTRGINLGASRISISTVGLVPGIRRLADDNAPYNLALSLHAANDAERSALIPVNKRWPLADLMAACRYYAQRTGRRLFVEWTLIEGKNDTPHAAVELIALLRDMDAHINLIPLNPTPGFAALPPTTQRVESFKSTLRQAGFPVTVRQRRGIDVAAGCGQLAARH